MSYLPWSSAWEITKNLYPDAFYTVNKTPDGCLYHTDGKTCWVEVSVTIEGQTQTEVLAVMNHRNASIPADEIMSTETNKSIKRALVKCLALFGLGLSLWNGEELSDAAKVTRAKKKAEDDAAAKEQKKAEAALAAENAKIIELCTELKGKGIDPERMYTVISKYTGGKKNPNAIETIDESKACYEEIKAMEGK